LKSNGKPDLNAEIFLDYVQTGLLPNLAEFAAEIGGFLIDNCPSHVTDDMVHLLTRARVRVITFAPRTTQIFQVPDVTLLGVLKGRPRWDLPFKDNKETVQFMMKVYHDFKQTMVECKISRDFQAIGFEFDTEGEPYRLLFNEEKLRQNADFRELSSIDFDPD
jgi:hypothetical protein